LSLASVNSGKQDIFKGPVIKVESVSPYDFFIKSHLSHCVDFSAALICYFWFFPIEKAHTLSLDWISVVLFYNLAVMGILYGGWHYTLYNYFATNSQVRSRKFNPQDQYAKGTDNLQREMLFTTLGFIQSSFYQVVMMHAWAKGWVPYYTNFWDYPIYSLGSLLFVTYWREFHFYWVHRVMHPWGWSLPIVGDLGDLLYKNVHKLHHKSYNVGPWSGLSMHPVEHFFYYTCALLPLIFKLHPMHFLYAKFHADIAPIGGHDGFANPGGDSTFHYLHHSKYDCNYGTPIIPLDRVFGTWRDASTETKKSPKPQKK